MSRSVVQSRIQACRFDYEYMGRSFEDLARIYDFPAEAIEASAEADNWARKVDISCTVLPEASNLEDFSKALVDLTKARLTIVTVMRQIENQPMMMALEQTLLEKAVAIAGSIDPEDVNAPKTLAALMSTVNQIKDRSPIALSQALVKDQDGAGSIKVVIQNQINS